MNIPPYKTALNQYFASLKIVYQSKQPFVRSSFTYINNTYAKTCIKLLRDLIATLEHKQYIFPCLTLVPE